MENPFLKQLQELGILTPQTPESLRDILAAAERLALPIVDLLTLRDLLETCGYRHDEALFSVLITLFDALREGSLCIRVDNGRLRKRLKRYLKADLRKRIEKRFLKTLSENGYSELITQKENAYLPLMLRESAGGTRLYFQKYCVFENALFDRVRSLLGATPVEAIPLDHINRVIDDIYSPKRAIRVGKEGAPLFRDADQIKALHKIMRQSFTIVSGGPGTGKTSLMVNMLRTLSRCGISADEFVLGAPTGRAAQRMTEALQSHLSTIRNPAPPDTALRWLKGGTLHKILEYRVRTHDFVHNENHPVPASVIVLDEVSMVDVVMMERFLRAVDGSRTRLILLGDKDQLPSVEAGAVFARLIPDASDNGPSARRQVILKTTYRSGKNLADLAQTCNAGRLPEYRPVSFSRALAISKDQWAFVRDSIPEDASHAAALWSRHHYETPVGPFEQGYQDMVSISREFDFSRTVREKAFSKTLSKIFECISHARSLTLVRNGPRGCNRINAEIARNLIKPGQEPLWQQTGYFSGAVIMITENDYAKELFNGDVGVVLKDVKGAFHAFFQRFGTFIRFSMDQMPPWEPAFSTTVHKSQGSEYDTVWLLLPPDDTHRLLTREILYTAITRAKKRVIIQGTASAFKKAISTRIERESGPTPF